MSKAKAPAKKDDPGFRQRRLSVSDIDTSEFDAKNSSPSAGGGGGRRQRRVSMSPEMGVVKPKATLPFPPEIVGTYSCHGVEPGMMAGQTSAKINQDRGAVCYPFGPDDKYKQALFMVFDGHGAQGDKVSHYSMNNIQAQLEDHAKLYSSPGDALKEIFVKVDKELRADSSIDAELSGTTAVVVLYRVTPEGKHEMYAANAGDSRAIIGTHSTELKKLKALDLTVDQKPDTPAELKRIKKKGGFVSPPEEEWGGPARVWLDANMTLPGLAMARSIGDHLVTDIGVVAEPEITEYKDFSSFPSGTVYLIMASDGVWEFIDSQEAMDIANLENADSTAGCTKLIETAAAKWRAEEGDYRDDITAVVVRLRGLFSTGLPS